MIIIIVILYLLHDLVDIPGELSVLAVVGDLAGLTGNVDLAVNVLHLPLLESLSQQVHLGSQIWKRNCRKRGKNIRILQSGKK